MKRILAWTGLVYMALLLLLNFRFFFTGTLLTGIGGLVLAPAVVCLSVLGIYGYRTGESRISRRGLTVLLVLCAIALVLCLLVGIPGLLANFRG